MMFIIHQNGLKNMLILNRVCVVMITDIFKVLQVLGIGSNRHIL